MIASIVLGAVAVVGTIASIIFLPEVKVKGKRVPIFWLPAFVCAIILLSIGALPIKDAMQGLAGDMLSMFEGRVSVNPVKILLLFFGMTAISVFLDEAGVFRYLATKSAKLAGSSQKKLFFILYAVVSILTVFTSNDIIILTFTPFICYFCKNAKISPLPYLVSEFVAANTFSMIFIIGNPTNIYLAENYGITFGRYFEVMALPTILGGFTALGVLYLIFRNKLKEAIEVTDFQDATIEKKPLAIFGASVLSVCLVLLVISDYIGVEMWAFAVLALVVLVVGCLIICAVKKEKPIELGRTFARLPYELIPFVVSMFIIVLALKRNGVADEIANVFAKAGSNLDILTYGVSSTLAANLINNIPMSVLYSVITQNASPFAVYASVVGSNIGAFLTPVGALAGIMFTGLLKSLDVKFSFADFAKHGVTVAIPTLFATLAGLYIMQAIM